jgi:hypothetical protein
VTQSWKMTTPTHDAKPMPLADSDAAAFLARQGRLLRWRSRSRGKHSMTGPGVEGITITDAGDRVVIEAPQGRWEGSAGEAERLLTSLHYVLARARPGTNIASMFVDGKLWGGKVVETDRRAAIREMRVLVDQLARKCYRMRRHRDAIAALRPALTGRPQAGEFPSSQPGNSRDP